MSWEEDFRRNIERTRQRIMEIAPDMLDLNAHRSSPVGPPPRTGAQPTRGTGTSTAEQSFRSRFRTTSNTPRASPVSSTDKMSDGDPLGPGPYPSPLKCGQGDADCDPWIPAPKAKDCSAPPAKKLFFSSAGVECEYNGPDACPTCIGDTTLFDTVASMLFHAKENSAVQIAIAGWYQAEPMLSAIRFAVECKKCTVYMVAPQVVSGKPDWFQMKADWPHTKAIDSLLGPRIVHWTGNGAGISSNISHNKFATFSQLDSAYSHATNVVVQQSNNWIGGLDPLSPDALGDDTHRPNDMLIVRNNPDIYRAYQDFFGALWASANKTSHPVFVGSSYRQESDSIQAFFFGNGAGIISDPDPRLSLIQSVLPDTAIVHVAMGTWTNSGHGKDVYDALQTLRLNGGQVYCLMNPSEGKVDLKKADISHARSHTHSKYMLIEGRWINEHGRAGFSRYVVAGSYNFQSPGMADALIQVRNDPMTYFAYLDNWYGLCFNSWSPYKFPCGGGEGEGGGQYP